MESVVNEIPTNVKVTSVYKVLEQLSTDKLITPQQLEKFLKKITKLHEGVLKSSFNEGELTKQVTRLNEELSNQKENLKKSGTQSFDDSTSIVTLKKELAKVSTNLTQCSEREDTEKSEIAALESKKLELELQLEAENKKRQEDIEPTVKYYNEYIADLQNEINQSLTGMSNLKEEKNNVIAKLQTVKQEKTTLEEEISNLNQEFAKIRAEPDKYRKQADAALTALNLARTEAEKISNELIALDVAIPSQGKSIKEGMDQRLNFAMELDKYRNSIKKKETECREMIKASENEQQRHRVELENRARLDNDLKKYHQLIRKKNEAFLGKQREAHNALKGVKKAKVALEIAKKSLPEYQNRIDELKRELQKEASHAKKQSAILEDSKVETYILITNQLRQEDFEKSVAENLEQGLKDVEEFENQLSQHIKDEISLAREITDLTVERDVRRVEAVRAANNFERARKELKIKTVTIADLEKTYNETDSQLKKFEELYEIVKNERNKYANTLQATQLLKTEMMEKIKILEKEISLLQNESETKEKALSIESSAYQDLCIERDGSRGDINKAMYAVQIKEELVAQGDAEIKKLRVILKTTQEDLAYMRKKYEDALYQLNETGMKLVSVNEELCTLYAKANVQENILRNGDVEIKKREEEIRILNLHLSELEREIFVTSKLEQKIPKLEEEKGELMKLLHAKQREARKLSMEMESMIPSSDTSAVDSSSDLQSSSSSSSIGSLVNSTSQRWRSLPGSDPTSDELQQKIAKLEERINTCQKQMTEKDLILQKVKAIVQKKEKQLEDVHNDAAAIMAQVNDYKIRIQKMNRKLMAIIAEISSQQVQVSAYQNEKNQLQEYLNDSKARFEVGFPPNEEALKMWQQYMKKREEKEAMEEERNRMEQTPQQTAISTTGFISKAEARPNMYVPEDDLLGIAKPFFGTMQPFKPAPPPPNLRFVKKNTRPLEISFVTEELDTSISSL